LEELLPLIFTFGLYNKKLKSFLSWKNLNKLMQNTKYVFCKLQVKVKF